MPVHIVRHESRSETSPHAKNAGTIADAATAALHSTVTFGACCRHSKEVLKQCQAALTAINIDGQTHLDAIHSQTKQFGKEALLLGALCNIARVESFLL